MMDGGTGAGTEPTTRLCDVAVIGGGPAGLAAAMAAREQGAEKVVILERDQYLGGILPQCIHNGFGLRVFKEDLTGPEYAERYIERTLGAGVEVQLETMVIDITEDLRISCVSQARGLVCFQARAVVLAMGCRERTRGALAIPGTRPAGVFTAGLAQRFINIEGYMPGRRVVILGSGDVGLIMARRLTFEGAQVLAVVEVMPHLGGLLRNKVQCLDDHDIPLYLSHTVTRVSGNSRVEAVRIARVDDQRCPLPDTAWEVACDTLLLSVGLIPENELSVKAGILLDPLTGGPVVDQHCQTAVDGIFACGNVLFVCDLVDDVSVMGQRVGRRAAIHAATEQRPRRQLVPINVGRNVRTFVPQQIDLSAMDERFPILLRASEPEADVRAELTDQGRLIARGGKKRMVRPGETERVPLRPQMAAQLQRCQELELSIVPAPGDEKHADGPDSGDTAEEVQS